MSPRERIYSWIANLKKNAQDGAELGLRCLERSNAEMEAAMALELAMPSMSDQFCAEVVRDYDKKMSAEKIEKGADTTVGKTEKVYDKKAN